MFMSDVSQIKYSVLIDKVWPKWVCGDGDAVIVFPLILQTSYATVEVAEHCYIKYPQRIIPYFSCYRENTVTVNHKLLSLSAV